MKHLSWWKYVTIAGMLFVLVGGILVKVPGDVGMLDHTIRNLFYHVPMWFSMMLLLFVSWIMSMAYLQKGEERYYNWAASLAKVGLLAGIAGITTGMLWASATWGTFWTRDPKLNGAAVGLLIYLAYWLLSNAIADPATNRKVTSIYNVFVYPIFIALIWIMPKLANASIHPGSGDTVGFTTYDLDNTMRLVFYPAVVFWFLLFFWIAQITVRIRKLSQDNPQNLHN